MRTILHEHDRNAVTARDRVTEERRAGRRGDADREQETGFETLRVRREQDVRIGRKEGIDDADVFRFRRVEERADAYGLGELRRIAVGRDGLRWTGLGSL